MQERGLGQSGRGFTLIEVLIASTVLVSGLISTAGLFAYAAAVQHRAEQQGIASWLVVEKLEMLRRNAPETLVPGGGLDRHSPVPGYSDYLITAGSGPPTPNPTASGASMVRTWRVAGTNPVRIEVAVYTLSEIADYRLPLAVGSTLRASGR